MFTAEDRVTECVSVECAENYTAMALLVSNNSLIRCSC